jgi:5-methyltetrahydrofolate--homocysteine methyltransferase
MLTSHFAANLTAASKNYTRGAVLEIALKTSIVILDGGMGTMIQQLKLTEQDYRGTRFNSHPVDVKGNNELLSITAPHVIQQIHLDYLKAGADILETNTFGATTIAQEDYDMADLAYEMNVASAKLAKQAVCKMQILDPSRTCLVAGAIGPTPKTASISPDVNDPAARNITFEQLRASYYAQAKALLEGGVDVFLVETIFDTLNAKAALFALDELFEDTNECLPIMISGTVTDASGRILSGQTVEAFWYSLKHAKPISFGLNCALGAELMRPYIAELAKICNVAVSCYPNAGLPNPMSDTGFDETPEMTAGFLHDFAQDGLVNIVGGCCGTTPEHIFAICQAVKAFSPRNWSANYVDA